MAIGGGAIALYMLIGGEGENTANDQTALTKPAPLSTSTAQRPLVQPSGPSPYSNAPTTGNWGVPGYGSGFEYPSPNQPATGYSPSFGGYQPPVANYQFRPLGEKEKQRIEQQSQGGYALVDPYRMARPETGPGLAGLTGATPYGRTRQPDPFGANRYGGSASSPPETGIYAPYAPPAYQAPTPAPYESGGWSQPSPPGYYDRSYTSSPARAPEFRPTEVDRADLRRRDGYSVPFYSEPRYRQPSRQSPSDWTPARRPRPGAPSGDGSLWADNSRWY